jgi:hypothetical protein
MTTAQRIRLTDPLVGSGFPHLGQLFALVLTCSPQSPQALKAMMSPPGGSSSGR